MQGALKTFLRLVSEELPSASLRVDEPVKANGNYWVDVTVGKKRQTIEFRPKLGFGIFQSNSAFGEGPAELYKTPKRAVHRVLQILRAKSPKESNLGLKNLRELYGQSQVELAAKAGVKQPAISRFEQRGEVKVRTLAATIKALGGELEVRAHFPDADLPISLPESK